MDMLAEYAVVTFSHFENIVVSSFSNIYSIPGCTCCCLLGRVSPDVIARVRSEVIHPGWLRMLSPVLWCVRSNVRQIACPTMYIHFMICM
jgi:hypothetical protein